MRGHIICPLSNFFTGICHGHTKSGIFNHGNIIETISAANHLVSGMPQFFQQFWQSICLINAERHHFHIKIFRAIYTQTPFKCLSCFGFYLFHPIRIPRQETFIHRIGHFLSKVFHNVNINLTAFCINLYILICIIFRNNIIVMIRHNTGFLFLWKLVYLRYNAIRQVDIVNYFSGLGVADTSSVVGNNVSTKFIQTDFSCSRHDTRGTTPGGNCYANSLFLNTNNLINGFLGYGLIRPHQRPIHIQHQHFICHLFLHFLRILFPFLPLSRFVLHR